MLSDLRMSIRELSEIPMVLIRENTGEPCKRQRGVRIAQVYLLGSSLQANKYDVTPFLSK